MALPRAVDFKSMTELSNGPGGNPASAKDVNSNSRASIHTSHSETRTLHVPTQHPPLLIFNKASGLPWVPRRAPVQRQAAGQPGGSEGLHSAGAPLDSSS